MSFASLAWRAYKYLLRMMPDSKPLEMLTDEQLAERVKRDARLIDEKLTKQLVEHFGRLTGALTTVGRAASEVTTSLDSLSTVVAESIGDGQASGSVEADDGAAMREALENWRRRMLSTEPANREAAEVCIRDIYSKTKLLEPEIIWVESPLGADVSILSRLGAERLIPARVVLHDYREFGWLARHRVPNHWSDLSELCCGWLHCERAFPEDPPLVVVIDRPKAIRVDELYRLHCPNGPAVEWRDGNKTFAWRGRVVLEPVITRPVTVDWIVGETNQEWRGILLGRMGYERFITESQAQLIGEDKYGKLWELGIADINGSPHRVVEVRNASPEPDGSFRSYFLRVPPTATSPKAAVAWTFQQRTTEYDPKMES